MKWRSPDGPTWQVLAIAASIGVISLLHYATSVQATLLHEVFRRLYYLPIVAAAVTFGLRGGLAAAVVATVLYLPHVLMSRQAWLDAPFGQYGEIVVFNLVGLVTGVLADRVRAERNQSERAARRLERAYGELREQIDERIRLDRVITTGKLASGVAHEVRNPLGALLGCLEILEASGVGEGRAAEFAAMAKREIGRIDTVVREFLEFACPPPAAVRPVDLLPLIEGAVRLAQPTLARRGVVVQQRGQRLPLVVIADADQVQRALLTVLLDTPGARSGSVLVSVERAGQGAVVGIDMPVGRLDGQRLAELFEPFPAAGNGHGLPLAVARRLLENQPGAIRACACDGCLRYEIHLPHREDMSLRPEVA